MIFGIDSYFKGINIAFISGKQLSKYAEGLESNLHQLIGNRGSLSVQYQVLQIPCWDLPHWIQARVLPPLLTQFWLWGEICFRVLGMLRPQ